ncbi:MAG: hypothetical protein ACREHC_00170 [Candidatus Levyibacteriota bacterium]
MTENLSTAINLATIANWIMIIGVAVLLYVSRGTSHHHKSSRKTLKK